MKGQKVLCFYNRKVKLEKLFLQKMACLGYVSTVFTVLLQEDISRLRRKLETTKKPDNVPKCDEILMEEIKDYKVRTTDSVASLCLSGSEVVSYTESVVDTDLHTEASREWFILLGENSAVFLKLNSLVFFLFLFFFINL